MADTVEAMLSHRPYRASKGLQRAVNEMRHPCWTLYDTAVVDTCLDLLQAPALAEKILDTACA